MNKNVVWCDFDPGQNWNFLKGLNEKSNLKFQTEIYINNKMSTNFDNILRYIKYLTFSLIKVLKRKNYNCIISWQQFYGLFFAFFCRLFKVKKNATLVVMVFIYIPKKGIIGYFYKKFIRYSITSGYIDRIILNSSSEGKRYSKELSCDEKIFSFVPLGEDLKHNDMYEFNHDNILFSSGFSNRNYDFLIDILKNTNYQTYIFGRKKIEFNNIHMSDEIVENKIESILKKARIVLVPLLENRESGQLTILHAMQLGVPIIATKTDCMKDYIIDGINGFLCDNKSDLWLEKINLLYENDTLYENISKQCKRIYLEKHTRYSMGKEVGKIINRII